MTGNVRVESSGKHPRLNCDGKEMPAAEFGDL